MICINEINETNMKRIYLDWNIITHLKDQCNEELKKCLKDNLDFFIFPFSSAHFDDLMRSFNEVGNKNIFKYDLSLFNTICRNHLLMFDKKSNRVSPLIATPYMFFKNAIENQSLMDNIKHGDLLRLLEESIDNEPSNTSVKNLLSDSKIRDSINLGGALVKDFLMMIEDNEFADSLKCLSGFSHVQRNILSGAEPQNAFSILDSVFEEVGCKDTLTSLTERMFREKQNEELINFTSLYNALDLYGYRSDKHKSLANINTDATHAYYASYCDCFVTNDKKCAAKAKAMYAKLNVKTKVINPKDLTVLIKDEVRFQFNPYYYFRSFFGKFHYHDAYQSGDMHTYWQHYDFPFLGFFNQSVAMYNPENSKRYFLFRRDIIDNRDMVFYSEIDMLLKYIKCCVHTKYCDKEVDIFSKCLKAGEKYQVKLIFGNWTILIATDPYHKELPAIVFGQKSCF